MHSVIRWAVAAFYVLLATSAAAGTIRGDVQQCMYLTNSAIMVLDIKEQSGMSWEAAATQLRPLLQNAIGDPSSYIKDQEDADLALRAFEWVWKDRITVEEMFDSCTKAAPAKG